MSIAGLAPGKRWVSASGKATTSRSTTSAHGLPLVSYSNGSSIQPPSYQPLTTRTCCPLGSDASATKATFASNASATWWTRPRKNSSPTAPAVPSATVRRRSRRPSLAPGRSMSTSDATDPLPAVDASAPVPHPHAQVRAPVADYATAMKSAVSPAERATLIARALAATSPLHMLTLVLWLLVPHTDGADEALILAINAAVAPIYLVLILRRSMAQSRAVMNAAGIAAIAAMTLLVYAAGGVASGLELLALWFLPLNACTLPRRDLAGHVVLILAGCAAATEALGGSLGSGSLWGFAVVMAATLAVNTAMVHFLYGRLQETTHDFRRRSAEDALTGLANRAALHEHLVGLDAGSPRAVYVIDVDGFKFVNDSLGHHAGDRLLTLVAKRLAAHARTGDLLARPGGDEFVLMADGVGDDHAALALGERLAASCTAPFNLDGEEVEVSVSVCVRRVLDAASG